MSRFVKAETVRLNLSNGDWLLVKARLNAGEHDDLFEASMVLDRDGAPIVGPDGNPKIDPIKTSRAMILAYLLDWSLTDDDGHAVDIRHQGHDLVWHHVSNLDFDSKQEILQAVSDHDTRARAAAAEEKKRHLSATGSGSGSRSLSVVTGGTTG